MPTHRDTKFLLLNDSQYFSYVVLALQETLTELGFHATLTDKVITGDDINMYIVCTTHEQGRSLPSKFIAYNFEQLTTDKQWASSVFDRFRQAVMVWDFSLENIRVLNSRGIYGYHVPLGFASSIEYTIPNHAKDVDVMFVGDVNPRRKHVLDQFSQHPSLNVSVFGNSWGDTLAKNYARSKIALNMHYYQGRQLLEIHRIIPLIVHRVWVVSESSSDPWLDNQFSQLVDFRDLKDFKATCHEILNRTDYTAVVTKRYNQFKKCCTYKKYLKVLMDQAFLATNSSTQ